MATETKQKPKQESNLQKQQQNKKRECKKNIS